MLFKKGAKIDTVECGVKKDKIINFEAPEMVYIPLSNLGNINLNPLVKVGDKVGIGTPVGAREDHFAIEMHSSVSGKVVAIEEVTRRCGRQCTAVVIENDGKDTLDKKECKPVKDLENISSEEIIDVMRNKGIVGLGGSTFPTYIKYKSKDPIDTILINDVECEPYLASDYAISINNADEIIRGAHYMMIAAKATKAIIAIKEDKAAAIEKLNKAAAKYEGIEVKPVKNIYPMGWEKVLVWHALKRTYNMLPSECGVIVNNSFTALALTEAIETGVPVHYRIVTLSGDAIAKPRVVKARIGTPAKNLIKFAGGYRKGVEEVKLVAGGPLMGTAITDDFIADNGVGSILAFTTKASKDYVKLQNKMCVKDTVENPCLQCASCVDACPAGLQPVNIMKALKKNNVKALEKLDPMVCVSCGMCSFVCPSAIDVRGQMQQAKGVLMESKQK